jgi:dephospho-CoA kinase
LTSKKIIGITGGIGSGKTFVCQILEAMGYPVFYSDIEAKAILVNSLNVKNQIIELFGHEAYLNNKSLNKTFLSSKIFNDKQLLSKMNAIVHPAVRQYFLEWTNQQNSTLVFNEAAIIFESGIQKKYDSIVLVTGSEKTKMKRIQLRDNSTVLDIQKRMGNQWTDQKKKQLTDLIIVNDDDIMLLPQINNVLERLNK